MQDTRYRELFPQVDEPGFNKQAQDLFDRLVLHGSKQWSSWKIDDIEDAAIIALHDCVKRLPKLHGITKERFFRYNCNALRRKLINEHHAVQRSFERSAGQLHESAEFIETHHVSSSTILDSADELAEAVHALPADQRKVMELWLDRRTFVKIAEIMGASDRKVRRLFQRAIENLRSTLDRSSA